MCVNEVGNTALALAWLQKGWMVVQAVIPATWEGTKQEAHKFKVSLDPVSK